MRKVIDYKLVLVESVSAYLTAGWQPWGSPVVKNFQYSPSSIYQAMVKYEERSTVSEVIGTI